MRFRVSSPSSSARYVTLWLRVELIQTLPTTQLVCAALVHLGIASTGCHIHSAHRVFRGPLRVSGQHDDANILRAQLAESFSVVGLMGSATPMSPAILPSTVPNMTVWPSARNASAASESDSTATPASSISFRLPRLTSAPSMRALTPLPVTDSNPSAEESLSVRASAPPTIAAARACLLARSRLAANYNNCSSLNPDADLTLTSFGYPRSESRSCQRRACSLFVETRWPWHS